MIRFPLRYARRNVLIGPGGEAAALYRAGTVSYPFLPEEGKWSLLRRVERFGHLVGADFSIWRVQRAYPAERYAAELEGAADPRHADPKAWRTYLRGHEARLAELGSCVPEVYLAVSLGERERGTLRSLDRARRRVEEIAGVGGPRPISGAELRGLASAERRCFERLSGLLGSAAGEHLGAPVAAAPRRLPRRRRARARPELEARRPGCRGRRGRADATSRSGTISGAAPTRR